MDECGLLCHLGIIDQGNAYYILKIESPATISVRSHEGKSLSLYRSGIGKCLLAWQPASVQASIISDLQWERATPTTITDAQQLRDELGRIAPGAGALIMAKTIRTCAAWLRRYLTPITT
jgi:DNA-binding IclR family transcriptional regulator